MTSAVLDTLRRIYDAINRNNIPAALACLDPDVVRIEPDGFPSSGTYRGHAALLTQFSQARATWAEGACEPEQFIAAGDMVVVYVHVHVRLNGKQDWIDARIADGFIVRDGKVVEWRTFATRPQALEWAATNDADTH